MAKEWFMREPAQAFGVHPTDLKYECEKKKILKNESF
jgi:hypothetical protein